MIEGQAGVDMLNPCSDTLEVIDHFKIINLAFICSKFS